MKYEIDIKWLDDHALELKELYFILKTDSQKYILQEKNWQDQMRKHMVMNEPSVNPPSFQIDTSQFTLDKVINDYDEQFIRVIQSLFLIGKERKRTNENGHEIINSYLTDTEKEEIIKSLLGKRRNVLCNDIEGGIKTCGFFEKMRGLLYEEVSR